MLRTVSCLCLWLVLVACATKPLPPVVLGDTSDGFPATGNFTFPQLPPAVDLAVPQLVAQAVSVSDAPLLGPGQQAVSHSKALQRFFAPWRMDKTSLTAKDAFWPTAALAKKQGYSENLQPYPLQRREQLVALQNMAFFPSLAEPAIVTRNTNVRLLPTLRPFFLNPAQPGQGYPFDQLQNSALWQGTPVLLCHRSLDLAWYYVETAFACGWVRAEDVALADAAFRAQYESGQMAALLRDDVSLLDSQGHLLGQTHIGALFPMVSQSYTQVTLKVPVRGMEGQAEIRSALVSANLAAPTPLPLSSKALAGLADAMAGQQYGWGGLYENRDCSSTMRDLFLPFGIFLPRNSAAQAKAGVQLHMLNKFSPQAKVSAIRAEGIPFLSLIWLPGHIGLYLGPDPQGEPLMLHSVWGVRTALPDGQEGRAIVGGLAVSTLRPGEYRADVHPDTFLNRIQGLTILIRPER